MSIYSKAEESFSRNSFTDNLKNHTDQQEGGAADTFGFNSMYSKQF